MTNKQKNKMVKIIDLTPDQDKLLTKLREIHRVGSNSKALLLTAEKYIQNISDYNKLKMKSENLEHEHFQLCLTLSSLIKNIENIKKLVLK